ncbi:MAG: family lipase [Actinobacteria bacterium]|nr:family lipase [Actinomycetota bacterium]
MRVAKGIPAVLGGACLLGVGVLAWQVKRTVHRPDLPSFANQDISGIFGDPAASPLRVVAVGDSSLTCPGLDDLDDAWLRRLARAYADRHRVELISLGVGGSRAQDVVDGQLAAALALRPDIAVVSVGGNDVIRGASRPQFAAALGHIVGRLEEASRAVLLIGVGDLGAIPRLPPALRPLLGARSAQLDRVAARVAAAHPRTVKTIARGPRVPFAPGEAAMFAADMFHASAVGHALMAAATREGFDTAYRLAMSGAAAGAPGR